MTKHHRSPKGASALAGLILILAAAQTVCASRIFSTDFFFDDFPVDGSAPDATKWTEFDTSPSKLNVSGGFLTTQRTAAEVYEETLPGAIAWPVNVSTWIYETRFRVLSSDTDEISTAQLISGARTGFGGRDLILYLANGNTPSTFGIGVLTVTPDPVPSRDFVRGQFYTVRAVHNAAGSPGYSDDTVSVFVDGSLYATYDAFADGGGVFGPPPILRVASGGYTGEIDYIAVGVPEPTGASLSAVAAAALLRRRRSRQI